MALTAIEELLGSEVLSEDVRASINEAFEAKLEEAKKISYFLTVSILRVL